LLFLCEEGNYGFEHVKFIVFMTTVVFANIKGTNKKTAASAFITSSLSIKLSAECIKYIHNCLYYSRSCLYYARVRVVGPTLKASRRLVWTPGKKYRIPIELCSKIREREVCGLSRTRSWYVCRVWYDDASESIYKLISGL
jgi:hypothetical protein